MIRNYLKILLRKQPIFTVINFAGLVIGMTAALLLFKYVRYEKTYDQQSLHAENIWRVFNQTLNGKTVTMQDANTHSAVGPTLKKEVVGVVDFARLYCGNTPEVVVLANNQPYDVKRFYATDQGFMRMFTQKVLSGNEKNCLESPNTAILTRTHAKRIFGTENVLGRTFKITNGVMADDYTISAVVADPPENTHLKFDLLVSYATKYANGHQDNFESYWDYNYFQLAPNANPEAVRSRLEQINQQILKKEGIRLEIQRFADIHLHSNLSYELEPNGSNRIVQFLSIIAVLILVIAFINYINLTTALANERAKEVGIRKALGASKNTLTIQFLFESFILGGLAFGTSVLLLHLSIDSFGQFIGRPLANPDAPFDWMYWALSVGFVIVLSLLTGIYPAFQLSAFQPTETLRGRFNLGNTALLRKGLVVVQFTCSIALIAGVLVVIQQLNFLKKHDLGLKLDQVISLKSIPIQSRNDTLSRQKIAVFKTECAKMTGVKGITASSIVPSLGINTIEGSNRPMHWVKNASFTKVSSYFVDTDEQFFNLFGIKILAGKYQYFRDFNLQRSTVTINKTMLKALGFPSAEAAIGEQIAYENSENGFKMTIGAVIDDFHIESLKTTPQATLYFCQNEQPLNYLSLKIEESQIPNTLTSMQNIWKGIYPEQPFNYWFLNENFANQYRTENQFSKAFGLFSGLAILISCLGLFGLVAYNVQRRRKEIGIRKVLGASVMSITTLLSKDFLKLVLIAIVIASPISYYFMDKWLADFAYKINIEWWIFALAGALAILIAFLTVGYQSVKAALINPVKSLKTE
jgi:putative ABC transport system permease protein